MSLGVKYKYSNLGKHDMLGRTKGNVIVNKIWKVLLL
jgi:hypothetical protein